MTDAERSPSRSDNELTNLTPADILHFIPSE